MPAMLFRGGTWHDKVRFVKHATKKCIVPLPKTTGHVDDFRLIDFEKILAGYREPERAQVYVLTRCDDELCYVLDSIDEE